MIFGGLKTKRIWQICGAEVNAAEGAMLAVTGRGMGHHHVRQTRPRIADLLLQQTEERPQSRTA
jgi:hypothetical protein